ncbi:MAG: hypothetical protein KH847_11130, partial [Clostridiales bacterium]|nr:hypothetical protein [Clostridiales bacterium]
NREKASKSCIEPCNFRKLFTRNLQKQTTENLETSPIYQKSEVKTDKSTFISTEPSWARVTKKMPATNAGGKALNIENLRCAACLPQVWVYATKKMPTISARTRL